MRIEETIGISAKLNQCTHQLSQKIEQGLRPIGLTLPQYSALSALEMNSNTTNADLARKCFVTPQTMNRILQNLLKLNLVKKKSQAGAGLKLTFELTPKAVKLVCNAHVIVNSIEEKVIVGINKKNFSELELYLDTVIQNIQKY